VENFFPSDFSIWKKQMEKTSGKKFSFFCAQAYTIGLYYRPILKNEKIEK